MSSAEAPAEPGQLDRSAVFERQRERLFGLAYRMLGSTADAEDLVQEAYLRWHASEAAAIRTPEAWLLTVVGRLAIDRVRRTATERAAYVGSWLPEPLAPGGTVTPEDELGLKSDVSIAFLTLLQRLGADERAAFLLREVFDCEYAEIARALEKTEAACRQLVHRAHERVRADRARARHVPGSQLKLLPRFLAALRAGDESALLSMLASDAVMLSDGGGKVAAAQKPIAGGARVAHVLAKIEQKLGAEFRHELTLLNREPAVLTFKRDVLLFATCIQSDDAEILAIYRVLNPEKLQRLQKSEAFQG